MNNSLSVVNLPRTQVVKSSEFSTPKDSTAQITERPLTARSVKKIKMLPDVELSICCGSEYDWTGLIKHPVPDYCVVVKLEDNLVLQSVTASLLPWSKTGPLMKVFQLMVRKQIRRIIPPTLYQHTCSKERN